jgi:hypothetical protein
LTPSQNPESRPNKAIFIKEYFVAIVLMCNDEEISGRIYAQFCALYGPNILSESQKNSFMGTILDLMHKLSAVRYHQGNFKNKEESAFNAAKKRLKKDPQDERTEFHLSFEFEAFLFQTKSTLDILVKLLNATADPKIIATTTFGNKGNRVIKGLEQFKEKSGTKCSTVADLQDLIRNQQDRWLNSTIEMRDYLNHITAFKGYRFTPKILPNKEISVQKPLVAGRPAVELMTIISDNLLRFCQDFMVLSIDLVVPVALKLLEANPDHVKQNFGEYGEFIKFEYGL